MAETTLYFVRHGETDYNRKRIVQGRRINSSLNLEGRRQAAALSQRLRSLRPSAIYTSSLRRAQETAEAIAESHEEVPLYYLADLDEMSWGVFEGMPCVGEVAHAFDEMNERWKQGDYVSPVEGGESILDVQKRGLRALEHILARHRGETVIVVTHGRFLRVLLASLLDTYGLERMHQIQHANTAVNRLVCRSDRFEAELLNCTKHLEEVETIMVE